MVGPFRPYAALKGFIRKQCEGNHDKFPARACLFRGALAGNTVSLHDHDLV
ncbi:hypothetical protein FD47_GL000344 [Lentilactobacillus parafarraginis DSM 18390 = JCM 14109]|uniref:Uncharacterized protein n=1 Tax=Lentilactobacillus parafarraginis DSM 18390 = JCM 14109 TaxID=1423786 RepID=A0A0R1YPT3_9LACO|nr:hypothetical protein FD47_GL000344 [Lentilactobacillus parafarraginis DSM 18390 = JCM 14109]